MDWTFWAVLAVIVLLAFLVTGLLRNKDRRADSAERTNPEIARALRKAQRDVDRTKGPYEL